ncbi:DUF6778 family protein [Roseovarius sp. EL26]|uniref:DUF6778 family protein n=1 Tax=Roseovarius sp. EL26 TaxID=2126672 RepID=UPI0013C42AB1|nr:DUF6778 family protein [Roseovarius sp. EL26]
MALGKTAIGAATVLLLASCSTSFKTDYEAGLSTNDTRNWRVETVRVVVPDNLTVSEQNILAPSADIVWRGDLPGDRKYQVKSIIEDAAEEAVLGLSGPKEVGLFINLHRFHALSDRAREKLSVSGVHNIRFSIHAFDLASGKALTSVSEVEASLPAYTGIQAIEAERIGETQKVRISRHIRQVIQSWMGVGPDIRGEFSRLGI